MAANRDGWFSSFAKNLEDGVQGDDTKFVLTTVAFPKIYVCVEQSPGNDVWGKKAPHPKDLAVFTLHHINPSEQGSPFKLSAIGRPDWHMYTNYTDNYVKVSKKVETPESDWHIQEIVRHKKKKKFNVRLYTVNSSGERVYAYMQDNEDHYVRCSTTEPGDNGVFIINLPKI